VPNCLEKDVQIPIPVQTGIVSTEKNRPAPHEGVWEQSQSGLEITGMRAVQKKHEDVPISKMSLKIGSTEGNLNGNFIWAKKQKKGQYDFENRGTE